MAAWNDLTAAELQAIADALRAGRYPAQPSELALGRLLGAERAFSIAADLAAWNAPVTASAEWLDLLAAERRQLSKSGDLLDLVWTGPDVSGSVDRETGAVMRELFVTATRSVFLAGYAIHGGDEVFRLLAERMDREPQLAVRMVVDIQREHGDATVAHDLVCRFAADFRAKQWSGKRMPEMLYDPRSLELDWTVRASMHAKCVVIDGQVALVTSANFTTAALTKNIELGLLSRQRTVAAQIEANFDTLIHGGFLRRIPMPDLGSD